MAMRKILLLGASGPQIPSIVEAKRQGLHVITCDNRPDNPGHALADEHYNVSTVDKEAVLELARRLKIDGILSYMSDVSAPTAAYVAEQLGLPTSPYESVCILTDKGRFRQFLRDHGFNAPQSQAFDLGEEARAAEYAKALGLPVVIKPVDSSGSKGVTILRAEERLQPAIEEAFSYSIKKRVIVETYVCCEGTQICGDAFSVNGELRFVAPSNQYFYHDATVPLWESWPCFKPADILAKVHAELQRLISLLHMGSLAYNLEVRVDQEGKIWIMELAPRNGGNMIPQTIAHATGVDLVPYMIKAAMGDSCENLRQVPVEGFWAYHCLYTTQDGLFEGVAYDEALASCVRKEYLFVNPGEPVHAFHNGGQTFGVTIFQFDSREQMESLMPDFAAHVTVKVRPQPHA